MDTGTLIRSRDKIPSKPKTQRTKKRSLINRTYLVMAIGSGLSAAIVDPLDNELMDGVITAELLLNKNIYCDSYLDAHRKK